VLIEFPTTTTRTTTMKFSRQITVISLSSFLLASATATAVTKESGSTKNLRRRHLQFDFGGFLSNNMDTTTGDNTNSDSNQANDPWADIFDGLTNGFEMVDIEAIQAMDPLLVGDGENRTFVGEDTLGITNCTGPISVTINQGVLTGLSTLAMDRFQLVPNTEQVEENSNWFTTLMTWSATFDMLARAETLVLETGVTIVPPENDQDCIPQEYASEDGTFSTGITITMTNPVLEMMLNIGGNTAQGFFDGMFGGESQSVAETVTADTVSLNYDTWTVTFDNPAIDQTINVTEVIDMADDFLQDTFNVTDFDTEGFQGIDGFDNITSFIQDQTNVVLKSAGFSF